MRRFRADCVKIGDLIEAYACQRRPETARKRLGCNGWLGRSVFFPT